MLDTDRTFSCGMTQLLGVNFRQLTPTHRLYASSVHVVRRLWPWRRPYILLKLDCAVGSSLSSSITVITALGFSPYELKYPSTLTIATLFTHKHSRCHSFLLAPRNQVLLLQISLWIPQLRSPLLSSVVPPLAQTPLTEKLQSLSLTCFTSRTSGWSMVAVQAE